MVDTVGILRHAAATGLSLLAKHASLLLWIMGNVDSDGRLTVSARGLAEALGTSKDSANRRLVYLEQLGYLKRVTEAGNATIIQLCETPPSAGNIKAKSHHGEALPATVEKAGTPAKKLKCPVSQIVSKFNEAFDLQCRMTDARKRQARSRWRDPWWRGNWEKAIEKGKTVPFLRGAGKLNWVINLEFFLRPDTVTNILEGKYDRIKCEESHRTANRESANASAFDAVFGGAGQEIQSQPPPARITVRDEASMGSDAARLGHVCGSAVPVGSGDGRAGMRRSGDGSGDGISFAS